MNNKRLTFDINDLPKRFLTPYRLLGFIEGMGLFFCSSSSSEGRKEGSLPNMSPTLAINNILKMYIFYMK